MQILEGPVSKKKKIGYQSTQPVLKHRLTSYRLLKFYFNRYFDIIEIKKTCFFHYQTPFLA